MNVILFKILVKFNQFTAFSGGETQCYYMTDADFEEKFKKQRGDFF